ncbi:hypothetical protein [Chitinimonas taiwanensis]|uniref:hypothetical protein n=1 Tax=Chitinimonas taiwanensis TaxID=240412 RepID=UPI0035B0DC0D
MRKTTIELRRREVILTTKRTSKKKVLCRNRYKRQLQRWTHESNVIHAPAKFGISGDGNTRALVLKFVRKIRSEFLLKKREIFIDFRKVDRMFTCGTLYFVAELDRLYRLSNGVSIIRCKLPKTRKVLQVFDQVGLLKLLSVTPELDRENFDQDVRNWKFATGTVATTHEFDTILDNYEGRIAKTLERAIYKGVSEAMTNCCHHAYIGERGDGVSLAATERRWWMFSQEHEGNLNVVMCDLGIGIPRSLPSKQIEGWGEAIERILATLVGRTDSADCRLIKAALVLGESRTDLPYRGKGLKQIVSVVEQSGSGKIKILSNSGAYFFSPQWAAPEKMIGYRDSIMGTLIEWTLPLTA